MVLLSFYVNMLKEAAFDKCLTSASLKKFGNQENIG